MRSAGHWTNKLYKYFDELEVKEPIKGRGELRHVKTNNLTCAHRKDFIGLGVYLN